MNATTSAATDGHVAPAPPDTAVPPGTPGAGPGVDGLDEPSPPPHPATWTTIAVAHAIVLGLAAAFVPWDPWAPFAIACDALAAIHVVSAVTVWLAAADRRRRAMHRVALRAVAWGSFAHLLAMGLVVTRGMTLLVEVYGTLGKGLAAAVAAAFCVEVLFTLPVGCWAWAQSRVPSARRPRGLAVASVGALALLATAATVEPALSMRPTAAPPPAVTAEWLASHGAAEGGAVEGDTGASDPEATSEAAALRALAAPLPALARGGTALERVVHEDSTCAHPLDTPGLSTVFAAFATRGAPREGGEGDAAPQRARARHVCVQAAPDELYDVLSGTLAAAAAARPIRVDVVAQVRPLRAADALVRPFVMRPGLDGLCVGEACTTPWQLAARRAFISLTPVPAIPDLRMGVDIGRITRDRAGAPRSFATRSYLVQRDGEVVAMSRLTIAPRGATTRGGDPWRATGDELDDAIARATSHIVQAQRPDGRFRYTLDPFRARRDDAGINLPRQAGTTLVLCELAGDEHLGTMRQALAYMAAQAVVSGEVTALVKRKVALDEDTVRDDDAAADAVRPAAVPGEPTPAAADLGSTALPAIAFLACRARTGPEHDAAIVGMVRFLLAMQLSDGTFHPKWDVRAAAPQPGPHPLFAEGQAVYALTLAEQLAREAPDLGLDPDVLHAAVERSLDHFSRDYWPRALRDFFFVEENWHCLAARALLESHRHDDYERFCLDYVTFKRRLLLHAHDRVHDDFIGGYGFGNLVPPQSTPTAGLGEALAAAIAIARVRGEDTAAMEADLRLVHAFLLRQQWTRARCFGCRSLGEVDGGFSESMVSPGLRIDYTQHALAALGHGRAVFEADPP